MSEITYDHSLLEDILGKKIRECITEEERIAARIVTDMFRGVDEDTIVTNGSWWISNYGIKRENVGTQREKERRDSELKRILGIL